MVLESGASVRVAPRRREYQCTRGTSLAAGASLAFSLSCAVLKEISSFDRLQSCSRSVLQTSFQCPQLQLHRHSIVSPAVGLQHDTYPGLREVIPQPGGLAVTPVSIPEPQKLARGQPVRGVLTINVQSQGLTARAGAQTCSSGTPAQHAREATYLQSLFDGSSTFPTVATFSVTGLAC